MNYKRYILIFLFLPLANINIWAQDLDGLRVRKYEGEIFSVIDSVGNFHIYKRDSAFSKIISDGRKYSTGRFTIEIPKSLIFSESEFNAPLANYIFSNRDGETLVIQEFMDKKKQRITTIESMPPCPIANGSDEKRYTRFYLFDRYLIYYYNVKAENNSLFSTSIKSIKKIK